METRLSPFKTIDFRQMRAFVALIEFCLFSQHRTRFRFPGSKKYRGLFLRLSFVNIPFKIVVPTKMTEDRWIVVKKVIFTPIYKWSQEYQLKDWSSQYDDSSKTIQSIMWRVGDKGLTINYLGGHGENRRKKWFGRSQKIEIRGLPRKNWNRKLVEKKLIW